MKGRLSKAAVIGSGVMGAGIAAHLANAGIPCLLLDVVPDSLTEEEKQKGRTLRERSVRNRLAENGKKRLLKEKPSPLFRPECLDLIEAGSIEDDGHRIREADWIIEAVVENMDVKRALFEKLEAWRKNEAVVTSNTSGLSIREMAEGRSPDFRRHFLGTHFFNPPRYMKLLELIPTSDTDAEVVQKVRLWGEELLGKGVVFCKDTPNFIANRIGIYSLQVTMWEMMERGWGIDEVDDVTGPVLGRPKSATFRTLDLVGIDTYAHVADNICSKVEDAAEREALRLPPFVRTMLERGWLGSKKGRGFYLKRGSGPEKEILALDYQTMEYRSRKKVRSRTLDRAKAAAGAAKKIRTMVNGEDEAAGFAWQTLKKVLLYAAEKAEEIADDIVSIDRAMKWGFNWALGPFEIWDAIDVPASVRRMKEEGDRVPAWIERLLADGIDAFYRREGTETTVVQIDDRRNANANGSQKSIQAAYVPVPRHPKAGLLSGLQDNGKVVQRNSGASLMDIGDGVACLAFHSKNNTIGPDILQMLHAALDEHMRDFDALVIGNEGKNFSVGANLMLLLMEAQDENWFEIEWMIRRFQEATKKIKHYEKPVVAAPFAMTLGGGAEVCLAAKEVQAAAETYIGLVEAGVGLIPAAGGTKEMLWRTMESVPEGVNVDVLPLVEKVLLTIGKAEVSSSAQDAVRLGYLRKRDGLTMNRDFLLYEARERAKRLGKERSVGDRIRKRTIPVIGRPGYASLITGIRSLRLSGKLTEHDEKVAAKMAYVLCGGDVPAGTRVTEDQLLDLEREAFLSLVGEPKTQQRMQHMLMHGKPLRN